MCRAQVAHLVDKLDAIHERGAELHVVGNGSPEQAAAFVAARDLPIDVYVDPGRLAYAKAEFLRSRRRTLLSRDAGKVARKYFAEGHRQGRTQGDPWQLGGVLVVDPDGTMRMAWRSRHSGDHPPVAAVIGSLSA